MIGRNTSKQITLDRNLTDLIKFMSCLMIALHHYSQDMVVAGTHNPIYKLFSTQGGWLGVAVFFFLSGYGMMKSTPKCHISIVQFFKKRLQKTYFPAVLVSALWSVHLVMWGGQSVNMQLFRGILWNFNDEVLWFVRAIVKLYIAFYAYSWLRVKAKPLSLLLLAIIASIAVWWVNVGFVHGSSVLLFFAGMSLAEYDELYLRMIRMVYPVLAVFSLIFALALLFRHDAGWVHLLIDYFLIFGGIILMGLYNISVPALPKWIGGASYDTYLVHNKALMLLRPAYAIVPFWFFATLTALFTILFYSIRKLVQL